MKTRVATVRHALVLLDPVVPAKHSVPACTHVLLQDGSAMANNLEVAVQVQLPDSNGDALCLPRQTLDFLKRVPGESPLTIMGKNGEVQLVAGSQQATLKTIPAKDFPPIPSFEAQHETVTDGDALVRALRAVSYALATDDTRPVLKAICLTVGDAPEVAAGDGFRLVWEPLRGHLPGEGNLLIPGSTVDVLAHLWQHAAKPPDLQRAQSMVDLTVAKRLLRLAWDSQRLRVVFGRRPSAPSRGGTILVTQLVQGTYPKYKELIPTEFTAHVVFQADDLLRALKGMARVAKESSGIVRLVWAPGSGLTISARDEDVGSTEAVVPAILEGKGKIALNHKYLTDYLSGKDGAVRLSATTPSNPALFTHRGKADMVAMPMFVQW